LREGGKRNQKKTERIAQRRPTSAGSAGNLLVGTRAAEQCNSMDYDKWVMKMKEKRRLAVETARMLENKGTR